MRCGCLGVDIGDVMTIYLIRHGKTFANENHLYCGSSDISLSENGKNELKMLKYPVLENAVYITSGMKRTNETLQLLFGDVKFCTDENLKEIDFGDFELKSYEQLKTDDRYIKWISGDNNKNIAPNGESGSQMSKRVIKAFEKIADRNKNAVVVTHGGVIAAIMAYLFPDEEKNMYQWQPKPGHGYIIEKNKYTKI